MWKIEVPMITYVVWFRGDSLNKITTNINDMIGREVDDAGRLVADYIVSASHHLDYPGSDDFRYSALVVFACSEKTTGEEGKP